MRQVRWEFAHPNVDGRIVSVDERFGGRVALEDGSHFLNPELEDVSVALRQAVKKAERVLLEAQATRPIVSITPEDREKVDEWTVATVEIPTVHVTGRFVLWPKGSPAHLAYPKLYESMPAFPISRLLPPHVAARLPPPLNEGNQEPPVTLLVVEVVSVQGLNTMMAAGAANPYLVAQLGGATREVPLGDPSAPYMLAPLGPTQRLVTQPAIRGESREWYDANGVKQSELKFGSGERFLVFLHCLVLKHIGNLFCL